MNIMAELAIIFGICLVSEGISALLPIALPASVISMLVLLALLMAGIVKPRHIDRVCRFLVANMAFFFVAPALASSSMWSPCWPACCPFCVRPFSPPL